MYTNVLGYWGAHSEQNKVTGGLLKSAMLRLRLLFSDMCRMLPVHSAIMSTHIAPYLCAPYLKLLVFYFWLCHYGHCMVFELWELTLSCKHANNCSSFALRMDMHIAYLFTSLIMCASYATMHAFDVHFPKSWAPSVLSILSFFQMLIVLHLFLYCFHYCCPFSRVFILVCIMFFHSH